MSESSLSENTTRLALLTLQDSPDIPVGVAERNKIDDLDGLSEEDLLETFKNADSWGWNRLLPFDIDDDDTISDIPLYKSYLKKFYEANKCSVGSAADAVKKCLDKENSLRKMWLDEKVNIAICDVHLSDKIIARMTKLKANKERQSIYPFLADAAEEAELMINWHYKREPQYARFDEFVLSRYIRECALKLAKVEGCQWSSETSALLLGTKKEAEWLCNKMWCDGFDSGVSTTIRGYSFVYMLWEQGEYSSGSYRSDGNVDAAVDMVLADHKA